MCFYIGIEDLAANALIEVLSKTGKRFLSYFEIEKYGAEVVRVLSEQNGEKAVLLLSRENTTALYRNYSEFFMEREQDGSLGIELKPDKEVEDLIKQFRGYLSLELLMAFINERSIQALGV